MIRRTVYSLMKPFFFLRFFNLLFCQGGTARAQAGEAAGREGGRWRLPWIASIVRLF